MLKKILTKAEFAKLSKDLQMFYAVDADNADVYNLLDVNELVEGEESPTALKNALTRVRADKVAAERKAAELEESLAAAVPKEGSKEADVTKLEKEWARKLAAAKKEGEEEVAKLNNVISTQLIDGAAIKIATDISVSPTLILPHIKLRLRANLKSDPPRVYVVDSDGVESTKSLADLAKEFSSNKEFASIMIGTRASGAGSVGNRGHGAPQGKKFGEMSETERKELYASDPIEFTKLSAEHKKEQANKSPTFGNVQPMQTR
jgi:hypothetical protein